MDRICAIEVERLADGRHRVHWGDAFAGATVSVFASQRPDTADARDAAATGAGDGVEIAGLASGRHYFRLTADSGDTLIAAQRDVPLERGINFRDLGGYAAEGGRRVRWGTLFRSGHMSNLTDADEASVATLGIRTVCDMRLPEELLNENATLANAPDVEVLAVPPGIKDPLFFHKLFERATGPQEIVDAMHDLIGAIVLESVEEYRRLFGILLEGRPGPTLINCSAGKERTGVGVAFLLLALGVPRETVEYDFMLSLQYFPAAAELGRVLEKYQVRRRPGDRDIVMPLLETRASYLQAAFEAAERASGSADGFLHDAYGLGAAERRRLQERYLA